MLLSVDKSLIQNYAEYYDTDDLAEWRRLGAMDKCANIVRLCSRLEHNKVLEIGSGEGAILQRLADLGFSSELAGLEISASAIRRVRQRSIPRTMVELFDGYEIPFADKQFDLAILSHVLEHVEYPRKLIYEAARVATNFFVEVPLEDNHRLPNNFVFDRVGHINFYRRKTIRCLLQSCGMKVLDEHLSHSSIDSYVYRKGRLTGHVAHVVKGALLTAMPQLATALFTYHFSAACTKVTS